MFERAFLTAVSLLMAAFSQTAQAEDSPYQIKQLVDGVYYHQGVHDDATESNYGAIANVGFVIGERCIAVIDSGGSYKEGERLREAISTVSDKPVCYVINTHVHPDHMFGNAAFLKEEPEFVGHEKLPAAMAAREEFFSKTFPERLGSAYEGVQFISPDTTVSIEESIELDLGNRTLLLTAYSTSHTDHDLTVYDQQTNTLWTGDLLFIDRIPALDGSINGWIATSEQLAILPVTNVIPGHGPAGKGEIWQAGWQRQLTYLITIRDQIREIILDFGTIEDATSTVGLDEKPHWLLFDDYHRRNVTAAFVELEWE